MSTAKNINLEKKYPNFFVPMDKEEEDLMEAIENNELVRDEYSEENMKEAIQIAKNTLVKKPVSLRLQERDINFYKVKALEEWIPYQTLMNSVIHRYAEGTLQRAD